MSQPKLHRPAKTFVQLAENLLNGAFDTSSWNLEDYLIEDIWITYNAHLSSNRSLTCRSEPISMCSDAEHACMYALFIGQFLNKE